MVFGTLGFGLGLGGGQSSGAPVTRLVASVNSLPETTVGGVVVATLSIVGPDYVGPVTLWAMTSGDAALFEIVGNELRTKAGASFDYETLNSYPITVEGTDSAPNTYSRSFNVPITNVNEAPTGISLSANNVDENALAGSVVGIVSATDPDPGETFTYAVTVDPSGFFEMVGDQLRVKAGAALDYETATSHNITIQVTDGGALTFSDNFTINVNDVNEVPTDIMLSSTDAVDGSSVGTVIATISSVDIDAGDTASYSKIADPDNKFSVVGNELRVNGAMVETATHDVTIRVTDSGGLIYDELFTIDVIAASATTDVVDGAFTHTVSGTVASQGTYLNGRPWVIGTAIEHTSNSPAQSDIAGDAINGAMLNPQSGAATQGWDGRLSTYNAGDSISTGQALVAGDILVKAASQADYLGDARNGVMADHSALFIVATAPAADAMSPAAIGWSGRGTPVSYSFDVDTEIAALSSYPVTGADVPSFAVIMSFLDKYAIGMGFGTAASGDNGYQALMPFRYGSTTTHANYGRYIGSMVGAACLALLSDAFSTAEKRQIAIKIFELGQNIYDPLKGSGTDITANGGHYQFHMLAVVAYLKWSGQSAAIPDLITDMRGNTLGQPFITDAAFLATMAPHSSATLPCTARTRTLPVGAVSGLDVTFPVKRLSNTYDALRFNILGMKMTRQSPFAEAIVTALPSGNEPTPNADSTLVATIDAMPAVAFADGDVITFEPAVALVTDGFDYITRDDYLSWYIPTPTQDYRTLNFLTEEHIFFEELGITDSSFDAMYGYNIYCNEQSVYDDQHDTFEGNNFASKFWTAWYVAPPSYSQNFVDTNTTGWVNKPTEADSGVFTLGAWIKPNTLNSVNYVMHISGRSSVIVSASGTMTVVLKDSANTTVYNGTTSTVFSVGTLSHVEIAVDLSVPSIRIEVDGVDVADASPATAITTGSGSIDFTRAATGLLAGSAGASVFDCEICDLFLDTSQILSSDILYNGGTPPDLTAVGAPSLWLGGSMVATDWDTYDNEADVSTDNSNALTLVAGATGFTDA